MAPVSSASTYGNWPNGAVRVNTIVRGSTIVIDATVAARAAELTRALAIRSKLNFTASAVSGSPLPNVMPGRSLTVHSVRSALEEYDSATWGS